MRHGKREMRRNYTPFVAGMITMVLLIGLISASLAVNDPLEAPAAGGAVPAQVGVGIFLKQQIAPGEMLTTEAGGKAPKVLSYADSKGETHYYMEATVVAELFDVSEDVFFREEANQLEFGVRAFERKEGEPEWKSELRYVSERQDFLLGAIYDSEGNYAIEGGNFPGSSGKTLRYADMEPEDRQNTWAKHKSILKAEPEYGKTGGMYTEVKPEEINPASLCGVSMKDRVFTDGEEIKQLFCFTARLGKYAVITIENTGTAEAEIFIDRLYTVGGGSDSFTGIYLPAGEKITRAFRIDGNKPLENQLQLSAKPLGEGGVSLKLTAEQYRSGN
ncbi:MAG: hypothetical protein HFG05_07600 [Oscillibacter sp.]|nr:hypothetical protein [Oscillibacter sp.]